MHDPFPCFKLRMGSCVGCEGNWTWRFFFRTWNPSVDKDRKIHENRLKATTNPWVFADPQCGWMFTSPEKNNQNNICQGQHALELGYYESLKQVTGGPSERNNFKIGAIGAGVFLLSFGWSHEKRRTKTILYLRLTDKTKQLLQQNDHLIMPFSIFVVL